MDPDVALQGRLDRVLEECSSTGPKACGDIPDCAVSRKPRPDCQHPSTTTAHRQFECFCGRSVRRICLAEGSAFEVAKWPLHLVLGVRRRMSKAVRGSRNLLSPRPPGRTSPVRSRVPAGNATART